MVAEQRNIITYNKSMSILTLQPGREPVENQLLFTSHLNLVWNDPTEQFLVIKINCKYKVISHSFLQRHNYL